jgi:hypothetical protein
VPLHSLGSDAEKSNRVRLLCMSCLNSKSLAPRFQLLDPRGRQHNCAKYVPIFKLSPTLSEISLPSYLERVECAFAKIRFITFADCSADRQNRSVDSHAIPLLELGCSCSVYCRNLAGTHTCYLIQMAAKAKWCMLPLTIHFKRRAQCRRSSSL